MTVIETLKARFEPVKPFVSAFGAFCFPFVLLGPVVFRDGWLFTLYLLMALALCAVLTGASLSVTDRRRRKAAFLYSFLLLVPHYIALFGNIAFSTATMAVLCAGSAVLAVLWVVTLRVMAPGAGRIFARAVLLAVPALVLLPFLTYYSVYAQLMDVSMITGASAADWPQLKAWLIEHWQRPAITVFPLFILAGASFATWLSNKPEPEPDENEMVFPTRGML